ncbi:hypothetical protein H5410_054829 [Solanum commersonii]|uniref:Uncharacterized protein n=1 Tax=Solanum commersonii TaxID=4109 RepID=A0A9J5WH77_SOLCO|nr:hypothetical protein H5410_054829 [Solanum commersonii]
MQRKSLSPFLAHQATVLSLSMHQSSCYHLHTMSSEVGPPEKLVSGEYLRQLLTIPVQIPNNSLQAKNQ